MLAQMVLGPQRVFGDVIIDPDEEDDAQIDEEQERENDNVLDAPPIDFTPAEDGDNGNNNNENAGVLTSLSCLLRLMVAQHSECPSAYCSVGKTCANRDDPTRMTYAVNEDNFNIYTPI
jgi:hypothetical protein